MMIIYHAILHVLNPHEIKELDWGIVLVSATAVLNYAAGWYCIKTGKQNQSEALVASGKHLQTDTYSTLGIVFSRIFSHMIGYIIPIGIIAMVKITALFASA